MLGRIVRLFDWGKMQKNGIFLVIDGLRYDVISDLAAARSVVPNLAILAQRGSVKPAVANAQATQFVLPSLFSLTYPLDYGGYNNGIRNRPRSYAEHLQDHGYSTQMMASCNVLGITHGYDRGFDGMHTAIDTRVVLAHLIGRNLQYDLAKWQQDKISEEEMLAVLNTEFASLLEKVAGIVDSRKGVIWPKKLRQINERVARGCRDELLLFRKAPQVVLEKMIAIPPVLYWRYLGKEKPTSGYWFWRILEAARWRSERFFANYNFPLIFLAQFETKTNEIIGPLCRFIAEEKGPWSIHLHLMDLHDCRSLSRPSHILRRLAIWPKWLRLRLQGKTKRRASYDTALMLVDRELEKLVTVLQNENALENTVILVTGDHGNFYAGSPRTRGNVALRTHTEDLDIPLILSGCGKMSKNSGMMDSMGMTATYLDALNVPPHESFKGVSAFKGGRDAVVSESAGSGNADLTQRDLYFTVTTEQYRMMFVLKGPNLEILSLYDRLSDPKELDDLSDAAIQQPVVNQLVEFLERERNEILAMRGYSFSGPTID